MIALFVIFVLAAMAAAVAEDSGSRAMCAAFLATSTISLLASGYLFLKVY